MPRYIAMHREPQPEGAEGAEGPQGAQGAYVGDYYWGNGRSSIDVIVSERGPRRTGLVDQYGYAVYRLPPDRPIGFHAKWSPDDRWGS